MARSGLHANSKKVHKATWAYEAARNKPTQELALELLDRRIKIIGNRKTVTKAVLNTLQAKRFRDRDDVTEKELATYKAYLTKERDILKEKLR